MFKQKISFQFVFLAFLTLTVGCSITNNSDGNDDGDGFDGGHEWIIPNPPAEFNLSIVDNNGQPISDAVVTIYLDDIKLEQNQDFINYDGAVGYSAGEIGVVTIVYLGDQGGGYEVPLDSSGPAELFLVTEAAGYEPQKSSVVNYLFSNKHITGTKAFDFDDRSFELSIIEDTIVLTK